MECLFCKIVKGEIKADLVYSDTDVIAFTDIKPAAPVHILIIPRRHVGTAQDIDSTNSNLMAAIFSAVPKIAKIKDLADNGYRVVVNCKKDAGQEVFHLHAHLLGGRKFSWPPG
jgi:histidine triad (HIT) family protein